MEDMRENIQGNSKSERRPDDKSSERQTAGGKTPSGNAADSKAATGQTESGETLGQRVLAESASKQNRDARKNMRTMSASEILDDGDWDDFAEPRPYHRHVRGKHRRREQRLWARIVKKLLIFAVIMVALCFVFIYCFSLRTVNITGNYAYSDAEILKFLHYDEYPKNTIYFAWKNREDITEGIPFVERISVRVGGPTVINVTVVEKMIIGCIDDSGVYMYFDNTGAVVESSTTRSEDVPLVTGLNLFGLEIGDKLNLDDESVFNNLHELSVYLNNYDVTIDQIDYNQDQSMVMHRGNISILLGMGTNLEDKINAYKDLEPHLEGLSGKLHLEDYDSTKKQIFFSKE